MRRIKIKEMFLTFTFVAAIRQEVLENSDGAVTASVRDPEIGLVRFSTASKNDKDVMISTRDHKKISMQRFMEVYGAIFDRRL